MNRQMTPEDWKSLDADFQSLYGHSIEDNTYRVTGGTNRTEFMFRQSFAVGWMAAKQLTILLPTFTGSKALTYK